MPRHSRRTRVDESLFTRPSRTRVDESLFTRPSLLRREEKLKRSDVMQEHNNVGKMMEVQFALMYPLSKTGLRLAHTHNMRKGKDHISGAAALWMQRRMRMKL